MWMNLFAQPSLEALIWLLPAAFFLHDGEEIMTVEKWVRSRPARDRLEDPRLFNPGKHLTVQFAIAVLLIGACLLLASSYAAGRLADTGRPNPLFVGIVSVFLLDGLKHVGASVLARSYTPGVWTAALVEIPYGAYVLWRLFAEGAADGTTLAVGTAMALPLTLALVGAGLVLGGALAPMRSQTG
ncbi:hypothetical protein J31TS4_14370 [Paenibacillus sp. J31TS4]|uniref:HXXEE domain-containing protein n=1 Tax=Paenibacillus sp. J31TS4 TaxID=2807195 RepID=UPI001B1F68B9|nr:HXXEE domain-containing protein [Paenibacillus sp. J31TS4]GIP38157.1 hypothetical protein J31TS4_14370 [Paenibacillus sp. J31TS4]